MLRLPPPPSQRTLEVALVVGFLICLVVLALCTTSCKTVDEIQRLPAGYWEATERLVLAVLADLISIVAIFF